MAILSILCVILLVNQMESLPLNSAVNSLEQREKSFMSEVKVEMEQLTDFSSKVEFSRRKRQIIGSDGCVIGKVKLEPFGCLTCEEYEDKTDEDCPLEERENEIP